MSQWVVCSALFGRCDHCVQPSALALGPQSLPHVLFTDRRDLLEQNIGHWEARPPVFPEAAPEELADVGRWQRNLSRYRARQHKVLALELFPEAEWVLWVDANVRIRVDSPTWQSWCAESVGDTELLAHRHHARDCLYQEAEVCARLSLDDPRILSLQTESYRQAGYPERVGLIETSVLARRRTDRNLEFGRHWWRELLRYSFRDQVSVNYIAWSCGLTCGFLPQTIWSTNWFRKVPHRRRTAAYW